MQCWKCNDPIITKVKCIQQTQRQRWYLYDTKEERGVVIPSVVGKRAKEAYDTRHYVMTRHGEIFVTKYSLYLK